MVVGILMGFPPLVQAEPCESWSRVIDDNSVFSVKHEYKRARDQFCSATATSSSYESAMTAAQNAGLSSKTVDGILDISFSGQDGRTSSSFSTWRNSFCMSSASDSQLDLSVVKVARTFSANARDVAKACYDSTTPGLKGKITVAKDKKGFTVEVRYQPNGTEAAQLDGVARIVPKDAVLGGCDAENLFGKNTKFGNLNAACLWDSTKNVQVQLSTIDKKYWPPLILDADPPPVSGDIIGSQEFSFSKDIRCSDPNNTDDRRCTFWSTTYMPKARNTKLRATINAEVQIGVSGKGNGPNACDGIVHSTGTDPWRAGWISLQCGRKIENQYMQSTEIRASNASLLYSVDVDCGISNGPVQVVLVARPRGCSAMGNTTVSGVLAEIAR
jgi:hypothetical protein